MLKVYKAASCISTTVRSGDRLMRVVFEPLSRGGSYYATRDTAEQEAIESHPEFGLSFNLERAVDEEKEAETRKAQQVQDEASQIIKHEVDSLAEAREYLADKFGISRTQLRSKVAILEAAKNNNVELVGLD